jgi:hypothetical protein
MAPLPKSLKELCPPALFYLVLSVIGLLIAGFQNMGNNNTYTLGGICKPVSSTFLVFVVKIIYILFWTWILNLICGSGHKNIAWILVLIPFVLLFVVVFLLKTPVIEGYYLYRDYDKANARQDKFWDYKYNTNDPFYIDKYDKITAEQADKALTKIQDKAMIRKEKYGLL